jgi:hypothetical protein
MKKVLAKTLIALSLSAMALLAPLGAAAEQPPSVAEFVVFSYDIGDGRKFSGAIKDHMAYRSENGDPRSWQVYTPTVGDDLQRIAIRACCHEWKDMDSYEAWQNENPEFRQHWYDTAGQYVKSYGHDFSVIDWENSNWGSDAGPYKLIAVNEYHVKPSHAAQFNRARIAISQIALDQGWASEGHTWLWSSTLGGGLSYSIVIPHANYAGLAHDDNAFAAFLTGKLGEEKANELMADFMEGVYKTEFQLWQHQPELSMSLEDSE